ncbi:MAG: hypothetical protein PWR01_2632 [Clostridiales bacterium]|jgi:hypothetical protein|nr:hypothetical protein [Clostridiales bacterium]MDN5281559.1 hypothetical protein [Candidatus Ozemobacter sp.]
MKCRQNCCLFVGKKMNEDKKIEQNNKTTRPVLPGLFLPGYFSTIRVLFWYGFVYFMLAMAVSVILNRTIEDGTMVIVIHYLLALTASVCLFFENRYRWFSGHISAGTFIAYMIGMAILSVAPTFFFFITTMFVGGLGG